MSPDTSSVRHTRDNLATVSHRRPPAAHVRDALFPCRLPVAVCVLAAYFTTNRIASPIYDVLTVMHGIPHFPNLDTETAARPASPLDGFML